MVEQLSPKSAAAVGAAAFLIILLAGWFLLVSPERSKASDLQTQVDAAQTQLDVGRTLLRGRKKHAAEIARLTKAMPPEVRMASILRELSTLSQNTGVKVNSITPGAAAPAGSYQTIPIAITLEGRYFNIARFLRQLNGRADVQGTKVSGKGRLYNVPQLQLSSSGATGLLQATLTIDAYTFTGVAPTPTPTPEGTTPDSSSASASTSP